MDEDSDVSACVTLEHVRLLGLPEDTQHKLQESTTGAAATLFEIRRNLLVQLADCSSSNDVVAAACQVLGALGRCGLPAEDVDALHTTVEALMEVLRRDSASAEVPAFGIDHPTTRPKTSLHRYVTAD